MYMYIIVNGVAGIGSTGLGLGSKLGAGMNSTGMGLGTGLGTGLGGGTGTGLGTGLGSALKVGGTSQSGLGGKPSRNSTR